MSYPRVLFAVLSSALVLGACSNGGGGNKPPSISTIANQSAPQDTSIGPLAFQVMDDDGAQNLALTAASSNAALLPSTNIVLSGSGADRTIALTPVEEGIGTTTITLTATDAAGRATTRTFDVQVNAVNVSFLARSKDVFADDEYAQPQSLQGFTFTQDADDDAMAYDDLVGP